VAVEVGLDGFADERKDIVILMAAAFDHRKQRLHETAAHSALCAEGQLPPEATESADRPGRRQAKGGSERPRNGRSLA